MNRWLVRVAVVVPSMCASASAVTITDDFNDGMLGPGWEVITQSGGASWDEYGGALRVGGVSGQTGELVIRYDRPLTDAGLARIDYDWIFCNDHKARVGLGLFDSSFTSFQNDPQRTGIMLKGIRYGTGATNHAIDGRLYDGDYIGDYHIAYSVPPSGSFLIERNGDNYWVRYLDGATWQVLFETEYDFGGTPLYPYLFTSNSDTNPGWQVALDNFSVDVEPIPGDTDLDCDVDFNDFNNLANNYTGTLDPGTGGKLWWDGDFDGDQDVDFKDFNDLANNYGSDYKGVPEPSTLTLLAVAALTIIIGYSRRRGRGA